MGAEKEEEGKRKKKKGERAERGWGETKQTGRATKTKEEEKKKANRRAYKQSIQC